MSPSWNQFCFLQPKQFSTMAKKVFATEFNIDTAQAGELIVEGVDLLHVRPPLLGGDSRPNQIAHSDILSSPTKLQLIKVFCCSLFVFTASSTLANHTFDVCWKTLQSGSTESNWWKEGFVARSPPFAFCAQCVLCVLGCYMCTVCTHLLSLTAGAYHPHRQLFHVITVAEWWHGGTILLFYF